MPTPQDFAKPFIALSADSTEGPFFSTNQDGTTSLQIVEGAQIDKENKTQADILNSSSHFNPGDLVLIDDHINTLLTQNNFSSDYSFELSKSILSKGKKYIPMLGGQHYTDNDRNRLYYKKLKRLNQSL